MAKNLSATERGEPLTGRNRRITRWRFIRRLADKLQHNKKNEYVPPAGYVRPKLPMTSLIIPAFNEALNLPHILPRIPRYIDEIILVDGRSSDGTVAIAKKFRPDIRIFVQQGKGKGDALRAGFKEAKGDIIVMIDADGSTPPEEIEDYVNQLQSGYDLVRGSRFLRGGCSFDLTLLRRLGNRTFVLLVRFLLGGTYSDLCYGFGAFWKDVLPGLRLDREPDNFGFEVETLIGIRAIQNRLRVAEVPSVERKRINGSSRLHAPRDGWRILKVIFREWTAHLRSGKSPIAPYKNFEHYPITEQSR